MFGLAASKFYHILDCDKYLYSYFANREDQDIGKNMTMKNPILKVLRKRILDLIPHGLDKVWVKATTNDEFHIANVLGIGVETWNTQRRRGMIKPGVVRHGQTRRRRGMAKPGEQIFRSL